MVSVRVTWHKSPDDLGASIRAWGARVDANVYRGMQALASEMEAYAQANAPWTDRTGQARATLHTAVQGAARAVVTVYLSHGMSYGKYLELCNGGRYAIIGPTMVQFYPRAMEVLRNAFGGG